MRTVDTRVDPDEGWWHKTRRDLALAARLVGMTVYYWTAGRKLRAAYRRCERADDVYYVDEDPAEPERRLR